MTRIRLQPHEAWTFTRLPDVLADHDIHPHAVVHVGAHHGEEVDIYRQCRFDHIVLVEPDPRSIEVLRQRFGHADDVILVPAACVPEHTGETELLYTAARTVWSGLRRHPTATGEQLVVDTVALADVLDDDANVLVLDTQGSELDLLRAADLDQLDLVIIETSRRPADTAALYDDVVRYMAGLDWTVAEEWVHDDSGYTDTLFVPA